MKNICKFLYIFVLFLIITFIIIITVDYFKYDNVNNSAPFYLYIIIRTIEFIIPSIILFTTSKIIKNNK